MAKINISTRTPGDIFRTNRRKCGWGSALTTCDICGRPMMGHNRGICSRCMRSLVGDRRPHERVLFARHLGYHAFERDLANGAKELVFAEAEKRNAKTAATNSIRREVK